MFEKIPNFPVNTHSLPHDLSTEVQQVLVAEILHVSDQIKLNVCIFLLSFPEFVFQVEAKYTECV